jgi:hypothetical protein
MSDGEPLPKIPIWPPPQRNGCLTAFMVILGVILLLPAMCTLIFAKADLFSDPSVAKLAAVIFAVGFGGIVLICLALRSPRP